MDGLLFRKDHQSVGFHSFSSEISYKIILAEFMRGRPKVGNACASAKRVYLVACSCGPANFTQAEP